MYLPEVNVSSTTVSKYLYMLSATFHEWGSGANDPDLSIALTRSMATFCSPEILYIICRNCYTSQGDPDSSFPLWHHCRVVFSFSIGNKFKQFLMQFINCKWCNDNSTDHRLSGSVIRSLCGVFLLLM